MKKYYTLADLYLGQRVDEESLQHIDGVYFVLSGLQDCTPDDASNDKPCISNTSGIVVYMSYVPPKDLKIFETNGPARLVYNTAKENSSAGVEIKGRETVNKSRAVKTAKPYKISDIHLGMHVSEDDLQSIENAYIVLNNESCGSGDVVYISYINPLTIDRFECGESAIIIHNIPKSTNALGYKSKYLYPMYKLSDVHVGMRVLTKSLLGITGVYFVLNNIEDDCGDIMGDIVYMSEQKPLNIKHLDYNGPAVMVYNDDERKGMIDYGERVDLSTISEQ